MKQDDRIEYKVHTIRMSDCEDPDIMIAHPIYEWQKSEEGKYVMKNSKPEPLWRRRLDYLNYGYEYAIYGYFTPEQLMYYKLRFE